MTIQNAIDVWERENNRNVGEYDDCANCFNIYFGHTEQDGYPDYDDSTQMNPEDAYDLIDLWFDFAEENKLPIDCVDSIEEDWDPYGRRCDIG